MANVKSLVVTVEFVTDEADVTMPSDGWDRIAELIEQRDQAREAAKELRELHLRVNSVLVASLSEARLAGIDGDIDKLAEVVAGDRRELNKVRLELHDLQSHVSGAMKALSLAAHLDDEMGTDSNIPAVAEAACTYISVLERNLDVARNDVESIRSERDEAQAELGIMKGNLVAMRADYNMAYSEAGRLKEELDGLRMWQKEAERKCIECREQSSEVLRERAELRGKVNSLRATVVQASLMEVEPGKSCEGCDNIDPCGACGVGLCTVRDEWIIFPKQYSCSRFTPVVGEK